MKPYMLAHKSSNAGTDIVFIAYLIFAVIYLGIQMFQGFSYLDIGFYMSGYQHFNDDPYVSYLLGQWLLSFNLTSALCRLFSINTYLGLRILHLLFIIIFQTVIYFYLKKYIKRHFIISGLLLATLAHFGSYTEINYNDYSVALLTLSIMAYHHGYVNIRMKAIILSGIFAGVSFYFRIVNITFIGIPFLAWLISYRYKSGIKTLNQFFGFFSGIFLACCATTVLLYYNGMLDVFTMTLADLFTRSSDPQDPHGVKAIIINLYDLYKGQIQGFSVRALLTILIELNNIKNKRIIRTIISNVLSLLIIPNIYLWESPSNITVGICLSALFFLFAKRDANPHTASLYLLSLFIPLIFPIGSNAGPDFYGKDMCFMTLPVALCIISEGVGTMKADYHKAIYRALHISFTFICITMIYTNINRPMMEEGTRTQCRHTINSPLTEHIYTSEENAILNNYLINKVKPLIPVKSYLICNFSIPIISLLECKPYAVYSTVFTSNVMNRRYIDVAYKHSRRLPYLLIDQNNNSDKDKYVEDYLYSIKPYRTIWTDGRYVLKGPAVHTYI